MGVIESAVSSMLEDIGETVPGVKHISEGAKTCETSKDEVVSTMGILSEF